MRFHWQDLNDGLVKKFGWHGRAWLGRVSCEWSLPTTHWLFEFGVNGGDSNRDLTLCIGCGLFFLSLSLQAWGFPFGHWTDYKGEKMFLHQERMFRVSWFSGTLYVNLWHDPMGGSGQSMGWLQNGFTFTPMDILFGSNRYTEVPIETGETLIPMPEGCYPASYKLFVSTWQRPRWPFKSQLKRITIDVLKGIPHEGKGENSWDCGEDATYGTTCPATHLEEGIGSLVGSVLRDRKRYGGKHLHRELKAALVEQAP